MGRDFGDLSQMANYPKRVHSRCGRRQIQSGVARAADDVPCSPRCWSVGQMLRGALSCGSTASAPAVKIDQFVSFACLIMEDGQEAYSQMGTSCPFPDVWRGLGEKCERRQKIEPDERNQ